MHALLAHAYHLALRVIHSAERPLWRSLAMCVAAACAGRMFQLSRARWTGLLAAGLPVILAWTVLAPMQAWPPTPIARLAGLGAIVLGVGLLDERRRQSWTVLWAGAGLAAWWLRGVPGDVAGLAGCVPVFFGLAAGFAASERMAVPDRGWGVIAGAAALSAGLWLTGAAPHWAHAALAPALTAAVLIGVPGVPPLLARLTVCVAASALVASDRGRLLAVDAACLAPLPVWAALWSRGRKMASA